MTLPPVTPQRVNRGGNLDPTEVIGRDEFIRRLWETLERQSALLTAERRMGKTSVVKKMRAEAREGVLPVYRSFENVRSRAEFTEALVSDLRDQLPRRFVARTKVANFLKALDLRVEQGPVQFSLPTGAAWKEVVVDAFVAVDEVRVVFFWDEVPVMVGAVADDEGPDAARELVDTLRVVRQTCDHARMVFTGSVGLHHVLDTIRPDSYSAAPTNDMRLVNLPGLEEADAVQLARNLFAGEHLVLADELGVARAVAATTSAIPFYIQQVVGVLADRSTQHSRPITVGDVEDIVTRALRDPMDAWEFRQYSRRISTYYGGVEATAFVVLDALAVDGPLALPTLVNAVRAQHPASDEDVRGVLRLLQLDHYIIKGDDNSYEFAFGIIGRAWRVQRDLP